MFEYKGQSIRRERAPLADRMRPRTLSEFRGQDHILAPGRLLRRAIQIDQLSTLIFYGPPGTGKTTLARIIANTTKAEFISINAVLAGKKDIKEAIERAEKTLNLYSKRTILFIDEVHRFNKAQQDALLPHVENGTLILIGATTENPYFEVNKALVSRSRIFLLKKLTKEDLREVLKQALQDTERGYGEKKIHIAEEAEEHLVGSAGGDARSVLNALELAVETTNPDERGIIEITRQVVEESIQKKAVLYDKDGDAHYDIISAFIKSVRGSDPDAALYWMAKMVYAGEDPRFIFRRMVILASEDIGMADPHALGVVMNAASAFDYVGMPEGRFHLAQACIYLSTAPKSNTTLSFFDALNSVSDDAGGDVPDHLKDASRDSEGLGHGKGYLYPHAFRDHWVAQQYLPGSLQGRYFYQPGDQGFERRIQEEVSERREAVMTALSDRDDSPFRSFWKERTEDQGAAKYSDIRERLLDLAGVDRNTLFLDLNGFRGLLSFGAARRIESGGVFTCSLRDKDREILETLKQRYAGPKEPRVFMCRAEEVFSRVRSMEPGIEFDSISGYNVLSCIENPNKYFSEALGLLSPEGKIALCENLPFENTRISSLLSLEVSTAQLFSDAEEALLSETKKGRHDISEKWLKEMLSSTSRNLDIGIRKMRYREKKRIIPETVEHWFRDTGEWEPESLGERIRGAHGEDAALEIRDMLHRKLDKRVFNLETAVVFVSIESRASE